MRIDRHRDTGSDNSRRRVEQEVPDFLFPDAEYHVDQTRKSRAENEVILSENAEGDYGQQHRALPQLHLLLLVKPYGQVDEGQHKECQRGVHAQVDRRGDTGYAERVPSDGDERVEVVVRDALAYLKEHDQRACHHREVDQERQPLAEHLGEE